MNFSGLMNVETVGMNLLLYILILIILWPYYRQYRTRLNFSAYLGILLITVFCVFAFWDTDYFHLLVRFDYLQSGDGYASIEDVYTDIAVLVKNYSIFRLAVWGGSVLLCFLACKKLKLPIGLFFLILGGAFLTKFSYGRVTLAMSFAFCGLAFVINARKKLLNVIFGLLFIAASFFFHKSALFGIAACLLAIIFSMIRRPALNILLIAYPAMIIVFGYLIGQIMTASADEDAVLNVNAAQAYLSGQEHSIGIAAILANTLSWSVYYLTAYIFIKSVYSKAINKFPFAMKVFGAASFLVPYIATLFAFDLGANTYVYFYRFLFYAMIPCSVFLSQCVVYKVYPRLTKCAVICGILGVSYSLAYSLYLTAIGGQSI